MYFHFNLRTEFKRNILSTLISAILCLIVSGEVLAQRESLEHTFTEFEKYTKNYREVVYCHLNKSIYIKGEMLGFSGYVFNKKTKTPSTRTKNLYCVIIDANNKVVKSKLVKMEEGFANNVFAIDSSFTTGSYTFKAYTNWMKNFNQMDAFLEKFQVLDAEANNENENVADQNNIDVQFLPEGGNLINDVKTTVGVIVKNAKGLGVPDLEGNIYDSDNRLIEKFQTNLVGIGRFLLTPKIGKNYRAEILHNGKTLHFKIDNIKSKGISISVSPIKDKLGVDFRTNQETLNEIEDGKFNLVVHNGHNYFVVHIDLADISNLKIVDKSMLFSGMNILTLLNQDFKPILERMYFNYDGINTVNTEEFDFKTVNDSTFINIPVIGLSESIPKETNISVSILPYKTKSDKYHHNIISYNYLQPYLKSYIENAKYYFTEIDRKKKYELDNLLITQGWSSYDWNLIFKNKVEPIHPFEDGIVLKANETTKQDQKYVLFPLKANGSVTIDLPESKAYFLVNKLYPEKDEVISIGALDKKGKTNPAKLYAQFFPSKIPDYYYNFEALETPSLTASEIRESQFALPFLEKTQVLEEVIVEANKKDVKIEKLKNDMMSDFYEIDEGIRRSNVSLATYINTFVPEFSVNESSGTFRINGRNPFSIRAQGSPVIYLDDMLINDLDYFFAFNMNIVDYITVNARGLGEGFLGANGVIKIYTSLDFIKKTQKPSFQKFDIALSFSKAKKYYAPKYKSYNDDFYSAYGVIDWVPNAKVDNNGNLNFTVFNPSKNDLKINIEGYIGNKGFISETKDIKIRDL